MGSCTTFSATATCPTGMYAFAGGGYFTDQSGSLSTTALSYRTNAPTPDGHGWTYSASTRRGQDTLTVRTRCMPLTTTPYIAEGEYRIANGQASAGGYAVCPVPMVPLSGGVEIVNGGGGTLIVPVVFEREAARRRALPGRGGPFLTCR